MGYEEHLSGHKAFVEIPSLNIRFTRKKSKLFREISDILKYFMNSEGMMRDKSNIEEFLGSKNFLLQPFLYLFLDD